MAHVYRAVWIDNYLNVELAAPECFAAWLRGRNTPIPITENSVETVGERSVTMARLVEGDSSGVQIQIVESLGPDRGRWTTTLNAMTVESDRIVWVDVQAEASGVWERSIRAPRVVREMLLAGGQPRSGEDILEAQPREIDDPAVLGRLLTTLSSEDRVVPCLVIAGGHGHDHHSAMQRATRASEILAGVAKVFLVDAAHVDRFNELVPDTLAVSPMSARLFLPGAFAEPDNVLLTAEFDDDDVAEDQMSLGLQVATRLGVSSLWPEVPEAWTRFKRHLDERRRQVQRSHQPVETGLVADPTDDVSLLRQQVSDLQAQLLDANILVEEAQNSATSYQDRLVGMLLSDSTGPSFVRPTLSGTIEEIRRAAEWVVIAESAPREIGSLDTHASAGAWANDLARLCASMERYALHKATRGFKGNYRNWCTQYGDYSDEKIALKESKSTRRDNDLVAARTFAIDTAVHPSGQIVMLDHAKIQSKGSSFIPRVFFHDDTGGSTGKMHIGFIGPHYLVPTSSF